MKKYCVDTGLTGTLKVSPKSAEAIGLNITHTEEVKLADQRNILVGAAFAVVAIDGVKKRVKVIISPGISMVGVGLMQEFEHVLTINFKSGFVTLGTQN